MTNPLTVSAQFAAFVWFNGNVKHAGHGAGAAMQFARDHWQTFLPLAHPGLGRLLLNIARPRRRRVGGASPAPTANGTRLSLDRDFSCN